jgi:hypothetical protein
MASVHAIPAAGKWTRPPGLRIRQRTDVGVRRTEGLKRRQLDALDVCQASLRRHGAIHLTELIGACGYSPDSARGVVFELYELGCLPGDARLGEHGPAVDEEDRPPSEEERREIRARARAVRAIKRRRRRAGLPEACTRSELDAVLPRVAAGANA